MKFCKKCGKSFSNSDNSCPECKIKLSKIMDEFTMISDSVSRFDIGKIVSGVSLIVILTVSLTIFFKTLNPEITGYVLKTSEQPINRSCPNECCINDMNYENLACNGSNYECVNNTCVKIACPYKCCTDNEFAFKPCQSDYECENNKCVLIKKDEKIDCTKAGLDISNITCSSQLQQLDIEIINTGQIELSNFTVYTSMNNILYSNSTSNSDHENLLKPGEKTVLVYGCNNNFDCTENAYINTLKIAAGNCPEIYAMEIFDDDHRLKCSPSKIVVIRNRTGEGNATDTYCKKVVFNIGDITCINTANTAVNVTISITNTGQVSIAPNFVFTSNNNDVCKYEVEDTIAAESSQLFRVNCTNSGFDNLDYLVKSLVKIGNCEERSIEQVVNKSCGQ